MGLMSRIHLCAPPAPLWVSLLLLLLLGRSSGQPSCARWTQSGGGWTCGYIASLYGQTVGALQALNPGLDCTASVPLSTLICVQGVLPPAATAGPPPLQPLQPPPPPVPLAPPVTPFVVPAVAPAPATAGSPIVSPAAAAGTSRPAAAPAIVPAGPAITPGPAPGGGAPPPSLPPAPASPPPPANASGAAAAVPVPCVGVLLASWDQCGGSICMAATRQQQPGGRCSDSPWLGICCPFGHNCVRQNDWYWQCRSPESSNTSTAGRAPPPPAPAAAGAVATPPPPPPPPVASVPAVAGDGATDDQPDTGSGGSGERQLQLRVEGNGTDLPIGTTVSVSAVLVAPVGAPLLNQPVTFTITSSNGSEWAVTVLTNLFGSATTSLRSTEAATVEVAASVINQGQLVLAEDPVYLGWILGPGQAEPPPPSPPLAPPPPPPARPPPPVRQQPPAPPAAQQLLMSVLNDGVAAAGQAAQVQVLYLSGGVGVPRADVLLTVSNDANGVERAFSGTTDDTGLATISVPSTAVTLPGSGPVVATLRASTTSNSGDIVLSRPLPGTKPSITWKAAAAPLPSPPPTLRQRPPPPLPPPGPAASSRPPSPALSSSYGPTAAPPGPAAPSSSSSSNGSSMAPSQAPAGTSVSGTVQAIPGVSTDKGCDTGCRLCAVADRKCLSCSPGFQSYGGRCGCGPGRGGSQCQACAVGTFSSGGSVTQLFPACSPCPEGYSTRAPGAAAPADCAVCATAAGYTCQTCVPLGGGSDPGRPAAGAGVQTPSGRRRRRLLARRLVQFSNSDGVPACYEYAQFDTVASERCDGLAARTNLTVAQLQALNPLLNCNSALLRGSMCVSVTCPPGFGGPAGPNCTPCPVGTWSSGDYDPRSPLGAACSACPAGYATSGPQATAASECTGCAAGFYCSSCVR